MPDEDQQRRERLLDSAIYDATKGIVLLLIASGGAISVARLLSRTYRSLGSYSVPIGLVLAGVIVGAGYWLVSSRDRLVPRYSRLHCDFRILSKEVSYTYIDRTNLQYSRASVLKARRSGVASYTDKFNWSGRGSIRVVSGVPEHTVQQLGQRNIWQIFAIYFGRTLRRGEKISTNTLWRLQDTRGTAAPFFSQSINEPTDVLVFRLRLPAAFDVHRVACTILPTIDSLTQLSNTEKELIVRDEYAEAVWTIKKPKLLHCYQMSWVDATRVPSGGFEIVDANLSAPAGTS